MDNATNEGSAWEHEGTFTIELSGQCLGRVINGLEGVKLEGRIIHVTSGMVYSTPKGRLRALSSRGTYLPRWCFLKALTVRDGTGKILWRNELLSRGKGDSLASIFGKDLAEMRRSCEDLADMVFVARLERDKYVEALRRVSHLLRHTTTGEVKEIVDKALTKK